MASGPTNGIRVEVDLRFPIAMMEEIKRSFMPVVANALSAEARGLHDDVTRVVPVQTGALRDSGVVSEPTSDRPGHVQVEVTFGGPDAPYVMIVHEDLSNPKAKFIERPFLDRVPRMGARITKQIRSEIE